MFLKMRKRTIKKNFWFSYEDDRQLKKLSSSLKLSESNVIRKLLYETQIIETPPKKFYEAINKINKIGVNINQIARIANTTGNIYTYQLNKELIELHNLIDLIKEKYL